MDFLRNPLNIRFLPLTLSLLGAVALLIWLIASPDDGVALAFAVAAALSALGVYDLVQDRHAVLRNYPISAHLRYIFEESMRPEMRQYFFETEKDGKPFSRDDRALVYQRAKLELDQRPFGTQLDVYREGYEWLRHSMQPPTAKELFRVRSAGPDCAAPYSASAPEHFRHELRRACRPMRSGAEQGRQNRRVLPRHRRRRRFALSPRNGGDLVWELGSGYFGARAGRRISIR
jgi:glutamate synthase domain-containing protein 2